MNKKVICILSDALCNEYIDEFNMKNLRNEILKKSTTHIPKISPSTGYCEIVEYVTGQDSDQHMMFTQINVTDNWAEKTHPKILSILDLLYRKNFLRKIPKVRGVIRILFDKLVDKILRKYVESSTVNVKYNIPYSTLYYMEAVESIYQYDSYDFGGDKNIFVELQKKNIKYDIEDFVEHNKIQGTDSDRLNKLKSKIENKNLKDFTLLYIGYGEIAHFTGKSDEKFKVEMQKYDDRLGELIALLDSKYEDYDFMILGDHGMIDVNHYHDIQTILNNIIQENYSQLELYKDYIYFVDSTMFRIWFKDKQYITKIETLLNEHLKDYLELDSQTEKYLQTFKPKYGDIILLLKSGSVFYPDFYNLKPNKGMHGYLNHYPGQQGTMIHIRSDKNIESKVIKESHLSSMKNYILNLWN